MKKLFVVCTLCLTLLSSTFAQRFAYVDTDYVLSKIPEYEEAQKDIDRVAGEWKLEISQKQKEIKKFYDDFQNEQFLLTDDQKELKIKELEAKEVRLKDFQKSKFGYEGELFKKRQELIKPIQDRVYNAIENLARDRSYDFIFDKANSTTVLYANPKNDKSDAVLKKLGYSNK